MSNVTLTIGGRSYTVACAEGEERHVLGLGTMIDSKVASMGESSGQAETRTLLFAALLLADELHEAGGSQSATPAPAPSSAITASLDAIATKLENLADRLES